MSDKIKFQFVDCSAGSEIQEKVVADGTTISSFIDNDTSGLTLDRVLIRVNRSRVPVDYVLQSGDRVTVSPTDVSGA